MSDWWSADPIAEPKGLLAQDADALARTIHAEAGNQGMRGKQAVGNVILNRAEQSGMTVPDVVTARGQFEPHMTSGGRARMAAMDPNSRAYQEAELAALNAQEQDVTGGATHFYAPRAQAALGRRAPAWDNGTGADIGDHRFFPLGYNGQGQHGIPQAVSQIIPQDVSAQSRNDGWWQNDPVAEQAAQPLPSSTGFPGGLGNRETREGIAGPAQREVGAAEAIGRGAARGMTANFYDELVGLAAAGGRQSETEPLGLGNIIAGGYRRLTGDQEAERRYAEATARERAQSTAATEQRPWTSLGGEVGGAIALPLGGMLNAATMPARMARGAAVGAGYGAVSGAGAGDNGDRIERAAFGAGGGAVLGGAAPVALRGVEAAASGIGSLAGPVTRAVRGAVNPEAEAGRRVVGAITRDMQQGSAGLAPAEFAAAHAGGAPVRNLDLGGETTRALARSSANTSPEGRAALQNLADARFEGQADRATQFIRGIVGGVDTHASREGLRAAAQSVNRPAYDAAYRAPQAQAMWDEGFEQLMQAPVVQEAARAATRTGANRGAFEGFTPVQRPFHFEDANSLTPRFIRRVDNEGREIAPNLQFWDHVKRNLDDKISSLQRSGENSAARDAQQLRAALVGHLDQLVPQYAAARAGAARFFGAEDALTAGENFVGNRMAAAEGRRALAQMTPQERDLFRQGFAAKLIDDINTSRDRTNVLNKIGQTPAAREKLQMTLGPQGYRQVEAFLTIEQTMDRLRGALGNSTTARQLVELGLAGGAGYGVSGGDMTTAGGAALAAFLSRRAGARIDERVARRVAEMLTSSDPNILAKGVRMAASNQRLLQAFRDLDQLLGRASTQQAASSDPRNVVGVGSLP